jgi:Poxvirus D5 protein-like
MPAFPFAATAIQNVNIKCLTPLPTEKQKRRVERLLNQSDSVRCFVRESVEKAEGDDVTVTELLAAYYPWCERRGWTPLTGGTISSQLGATMLETHHTAQRHDIMRGGKQVRGYKNVWITGI